MASGGKGGAYTPVVVSSNPYSSWRPGGDGGDGGIGGQIVAGGGADGGHATLVTPGSPPTWARPDGAQGFWNAVTGIGEGGGGGVGFTGGGNGVGQDAAWITELPTLGYSILSVHGVDESNGGAGNFNYADPTKSGPKQAKPTKTFSTADFNIYNPRTFTAPLPGGGGGARPTPLAKYGSYAAGYSPNGIVIVRVS